MHLDQLEAGILLAKDVYDPNGCILIRSGVLLTERHIKALKSWGISEVEIQTADGPPQPARDPTAVTEVRELLDTQFALSNTDHPAVQALYEICLERAIRQRRGTCR